MHITLNGQDFLVKYPIASLCAIERQLGLTSSQIISDLSERKFAFGHAVALIWGGILHADNGVSPQAVAQWLDESEQSVVKLYDECAMEFMNSLKSKLHRNGNKSNEGLEDEVKN